MHERERWQVIKGLLRERSLVRIADACRATGVSEASVRRDFARLAEQGVAIRVHGGLEALPDTTNAPGDVLSLATRSFDVSQTLNIDAKRAIAKAAVALCADGETIIVNGGTTTYQMGDYLRERRLKVLTNSYPLAEVLIHKSKCRVALPGGEVYREQGMIVSPFEEDAIQHYSATRMFMSAISIGPLGVIEGDPLLARAEIQALEARRQADRARRFLEIRLARQPRRLPAVAHRYADHRRRRAGCRARHVARPRRPRRRRRDRRRRYRGGVKRWRMITPSVKAPRRPCSRCATSRSPFPVCSALSGVSFDVAKGEVHALLGENGAGKSTLIKIVSGVFPPDRGEVIVDGKPVNLQRPDDARRAGIATIYQELLLFPELTVAENIFMGHAPRARLGRLDWRAMRDKTTDAARFTRDSRPAGRSRRRLAQRRQSPARRNPARAVAGRAHPDHGRADRGADRIRRDAAVRHRAQAEGARRRRDLYQPPARRDFRDRRSRHRAARRRACRDQARRRHRRRPNSCT